MRGLPRYLKYRTVYLCRFAFKEAGKPLIRELLDALIRRGVGLAAWDS